MGLKILEYDSFPFETERPIQVFTMFYSSLWNQPKDTEAEQIWYISFVSFSVYIDLLGD